MSCLRKLFLDERVFVLAEVCLPRRPHAALPRSQVPSRKRKWHKIEVGLHADGSEDRRPLEQTSARLKITFVDMT